MEHDIQIKQLLSSFETKIESKEEKLRLKGLITQRVGEEVRVLVSFWYEL